MESDHSTILWSIQQIAPRSIRIASILEDTCKDEQELTNILHACRCKDTLEALQCLHSEVQRRMNAADRSGSTTFGEVSCRSYAAVFHQVASAYFYDRLAFDGHPRFAIDFTSNHAFNKVILKDANGKQHSFFVDVGWMNPGILIPETPSQQSLPNLTPRTKPQTCGY